MAPVFRIGYLIASKEFVDEASKLRGIVDRQGDALLELTLAVWAKLNSKYSWATVAEVAKKHNLEIGNWQRYDSAKLGHNCIRIGFASYNEAEIQELIHRFKKTIEETMEMYRCPQLF